MSSKCPTWLSSLARLRVDANDRRAGVPTEARSAAAAPQSESAVTSAREIRHRVAAKPRMWRAVAWYRTALCTNTTIPRKRIHMVEEAPGSPTRPARSFHVEDKNQTYCDQSDRFFCLPNFKRKLLNAPANAHLQHL